MPPIDLPKPATLHTFLDLYTKSSKECYLEHFAGAKALHSWLTSPIYPELELPAGSPPNVPDQLISYTVIELAKITSGYPNKNTDLNIYALHINAIAAYYINKVTLL